MTSAKRWLLPDGVEEILPAEAYKLECLRREILDLYASWGYELVITPLIEFLDSLLVGSSHDLDLHTFKVTDQLSGRMMGIRADITPQAARIDAHCLNREGPVRLCYADNVLHTRPRGLQTSRVPIRVGAELYGHRGEDCDIELICLMLETLKPARVEKLHLVLGHVGIFRSLVAEAGLEKDTEPVLFEAMQRKAYDEIDDILQAAVSDRALRAMLQQLARLSGDESTLQTAQQVFAGAPPSVKREMDELSTIAGGVRARQPDLEIRFDLCELRGYEYHTGIVFAAYTPEYGRAVAKGGRYDHIGEVFGRARPASGFDSDLKTLAKLTCRDFPLKKTILAPSSADGALAVLTGELRKKGEAVITELDDEGANPEILQELNCDRRIVRRGKDWVVENI